MQSLKDLFRYGMGPSSSHTMGPRRAAETFRQRCGDCEVVQAHLYGSLCLTGRGHLTDRAVIDGLAPLPCEVVWHEEVLPFHPNGMRFQALRGGVSVCEWTVYSVGGGDLREEGQAADAAGAVYPCRNMEQIMRWAQEGGVPIWKLAQEHEPEVLREYLPFVWEKMQEALLRGLHCEGALPGGLNLQRRARAMLARGSRLRAGESRTGVLSAYALAVAEENGSGGYVVTAPTCGSCGIVPAVLYYLQNDMGFMQEDILSGLATAGIFGNVVKKNASVSGAEVGCQGEVGVACAMAAAAAAQVMGGSARQVEYAAEMGLEHHLGLTCDPVMGLVQIPCIERNAFAALSALSCAEYSLLSDGSHRVSFDEVVEAMNRTGHDLPSLYRETAQGGLAAVLRGCCR